MKLFELFDINEITAINDFKDEYGYQYHKKSFYSGAILIKKEYQYALLRTRNIMSGNINYGWFLNNKKFNEPSAIADEYLVAFGSLGTSKDGHYFVTIIVEPRYRGKGFAAKIYEQALDDGFGPLRSDSHQTKSGTEIWKKFLQSGKYTMWSKDTETGETSTLEIKNGNLYSPLDLSKKSVIMYMDK